MVRQQLLARGIRDRRVLEALETVPRERFVAEEIADQAYEDSALAIECGQTISQPYIVALMTEALQLTGRERVLEVGTGSGYQAAVLSLLAREVVSIERHPPLAQQAAERLAAMGCGNLIVLMGDGSQGAPDFAPFDRIIVTAAAEEVPAPLIEQLREGGLLVAPIGPPGAQQLQRLQKREGHLAGDSLVACRFVPLVSGEPEE